MLLFNLKIAFRNLLQNKVFSAINITGLALSIASCMIISLYIWSETHYDTFHKNLANIYRITEKQNQAGTLYNVAVTPGPLAPALQKDFPEITNAVRFGNWGGILKHGTDIYEEKNIQLTDNSIFKVFNFPLLQGNPATALQSPADIVITETIAAKYFGNGWRSNPNLLGQTFKLGNDAEFKLAGIAKDVPGNSSIRFDILLPLSYLFASDEWSNKWNSNNYHTYLQLMAGTDITAFKNKIANQLHKYNNDSHDLMLLQPLKDQYLRSAFDFKTDWGKRSDIKYVNIFTGAGLLLLIIACVNFINLSTARSLKRAQEVGIRKVNGASRRQLVFQFLCESVLIAFIAGLLSVCIISLVQPLINTITGASVNINFSQPVFIFFFLLFIVTIGLLAGLYPAFILSGFKPAKVLKKAYSTGSGKLFRQALVVGQFTVSVTLVICTFFMYRQLQFMQTKDIGFKKEQLVRVALGGQLTQKALLFKQDVISIAGVTSAAPSTMSMVNVDNSSYLEWDGMQASDKFLITQANVDPSFIPALGMQILSGNNFSFQKTNDTTNYIVNAQTVKKMGYTNNSILGKQVNFWGAKGKIIGVVKDFHYKPLNSGIEPFIFRYQPQERYFNLFVKIMPGQSKNVIEKIGQLYKKYEAEVPFQFSFVSDAIDKSYEDDKRTASIFSLFAGLTIFVGCLGLFGLAVFSAERRVKEIGIRKVLGAGVASIAGLISADFLKLVILSNIIAIPASWYFTGKWLQNYAYRVAVDWWVFAVAGFGVVLAALLTISFQAVKSALSNPVNSLRAE